jgi:hypothetical protein
MMDHLDAGFEFARQIKELSGEEKTAIELLGNKTKEKRPETRARKSEQRPELRV